MNKYYCGFCKGVNEEHCEDCKNNLHKIIKEYLKKNIEISVSVDRSCGYLEIKSTLKLDGEEIDHSTDSIYVGTND